MKRFVRRLISKIRGVQDIATSRLEQEEKEKRKALDRSFAKAVKTGRTF